MEEYQKKCEKNLETAAELTIQANALDPDIETTNDDTMSGWQTRYDAALTAFNAAMQVIATPPVQPVAAAQGQVTADRSHAVRPRANDPMKPNALAPDAKPLVLRA